MKENLITERGVNIHIYPFKKSDQAKEIIHKGQKIFIGNVGSQWDYNCFRFMDYLSTTIRGAFDQWCIDQSGTVIKSSHDARLNHLQFLSSPEKITDLDTEYYSYQGSADPSLLKAYNNIMLEIPINKILRSTCLKGITSSTLKLIIERLSLCEMIYQYQILSEERLKKNGFRKHDFHYVYKSSRFEKFFNFEFIPGNKKVNGKEYGAKYKIRFNTVLGALFIHNLLTGAYCLIKEPFYSLSRDANMVFRKRFLAWSNMITTLKMETVMNNLGYNWKNKSLLNKKFTNIVDELTDNNLILIENIKNISCGTYFKARKV